MTTPIKALFAVLATGAMSASAAAPAMAESRIGINIGVQNGHGHGYNRGNAREAVQACSLVAERQANRNSNGRARITDISNVRDTRMGFEVRGRIAVNSRDHGWNDRGQDNRGWNNRDRNRDTGSFTCRVERGRVAYLDFDGIRGL